MARHSFIKDRISTRDRFVSVLHSHKKPDFQAKVPWYRTRANFLAILMILLIFAFLLIVKTINQVQDTSQKADNPAMNYEEAKEIFSNTASK